MAEKITIKQGQLGQIAGRDITYDIPSDGEIFQSNGLLGYRQGNNIYFLDYTQYLPNPGTQGITTHGAWQDAAYKDILNQAGITTPIAQLPNYPYAWTEKNQLQAQGINVAYGTQITPDMLKAGTIAGQPSPLTETLTTPGATTYKEAGLPETIPQPSTGAPPTTQPGAPLTTLPGVETPPYHTLGSIIGEPTAPTAAAPTIPTGFGASSYTGTSIVDYLKSLGKPSDFDSRKELAGQLGIANYIGTADQNLQLLSILRGQTPTTAPTAPPLSQLAPGQVVALGTIGTWYDPTTGQGYSGAKKKDTDVAANPTTGQPITPITPPATTPQLAEAPGYAGIPMTYKDTTVTPLTVTTTPEGKIVPIEEMPPTTPAPITISKETGQAMPFTMPRNLDEKSAMDNILSWVNAQKSAYGTSQFPFNDREQMIEQGVATWGGAYRQFIIDTIYRELRGANEPAYQAPAQEVYQGKLPVELTGATGEEEKLTVKEEDGKVVVIDEAENPIGEVDEDTGTYVPYLTEDDIRRIVRGEIPPSLTEDDISRILEGKLPAGLTKDDVRALMGEIPAGLTEEDVKRIIEGATAVGLTEEEIKKWIVEAMPSLPTYPTKEEIQGWIGEATAAVAPMEGAIRINPTTGVREVYSPEGEWIEMPEAAGLTEEQIKGWIDDLAAQGLSDAEMQEWLQSAIETAVGTVPTGVTEEQVKNIIDTATSGLNRDEQLKSIEEQLAEITSKTAGITTEVAKLLGEQEQNLIDLIDKRLSERPTYEPFAWTDADTQAVKIEFEELYGPYYTTAEAISKRGAREAMAELEETAGLALRRESRNLEEALSESRAAMASRGLAFSGIRGKEEAKVQTVSAEEMQRIRDIAARGRTQELSQLEAQIGTEATQGLYPGYQLAPEYANLGIQFPRGTAITGIPGTVPAEKEMAYRQELARREAEARQKYLSDILMQEYYSV